MKYLIVVIFYFLAHSSFSQKCDRPEEVYIRLGEIDSASVLNCWGKSELHIYLQDSSEVFVQKTEPRRMAENQYSEIDFRSINQLRRQEIEIMRCEASKADGSVYIDIDINSVFKKIYMVVTKDERPYKFQVYWVDGIE